MSYKLFFYVFICHLILNDIYIQAQFPDDLLPPLACKKFPNRICKPDMHFFNFATISRPVPTPNKNKSQKKTFGKKTQKSV